MTQVESHTPVRKESEIAGAYLADEREPACVRLGAAIIWAALLLMVAMVYANDANLYLAHPRWLVPISLWLVWRHQNPIMGQLQEVVFLYIVVLVFLAAMPIYWDMHEISAEVIPVRISATVCCVLLAVIGHAVSLWDGPLWRDLMSPGEAPILLGAALLCLFGVALFVILHVQYGYGWEQDRHVAGRLGGCILLAVLAKPVAKSCRQRGSFGVLTALLLLGGV